MFVKFLIIFLVVLVGSATKASPLNKNGFSAALLDKRSKEESRFQSKVTEMALKWISKMHISKEAMSNFREKTTNCTTKIRTNVRQVLRSIHYKPANYSSDQHKENPECIQSIAKIFDLSKSVISHIKSHTTTDLKRLIVEMRSRMFWKKSSYIQSVWDDTDNCDMHPKSLVRFNAAWQCYENATTTMKFEFRKFIGLLDFKISKRYVTDPQRIGIHDCMFINEFPVFSEEISAKLKTIMEYFAVCKHKQ